MADKKQEGQGIGKTLLRAGAIGTAAAAGSAAGYYGGGYIANQVLRSPAMQRWARTRSPEQVARALKGVKVTSGALAAPAAAVGTAFTLKAIEDEVEKLRKKRAASSHEKVAAVYDTYCEALKVF